MRIPMKTLILSLVAIVMMSQTIIAQEQPQLIEKPVVYDGGFFANKFYAGTTFAEFMKKSCKGLSKNKCSFLGEDFSSV